MLQQCLCFHDVFVAIYFVLMELVRVEYPSHRPSAVAEDSRDFEICDEAACEYPNSGESACHWESGRCAIEIKCV